MDAELLQQVAKIIRLGKKAEEGAKSKTRPLPSVVVSLVVAELKDGKAFIALDTVGESEEDCDVEHFGLVSDSLDALIDELPADILKLTGLRKRPAAAQ